MVREMLLHRQDTYKGNPWNPSTQNRYTYVGNSPTNYTDPTGHCWNIVLGAAVGLAVGAAMYTLTAKADKSFNWKDLAINAVSGAVVGGVAGATFNPVILFEAGFGTNFAGSLLSTALDRDGTNSGKSGAQALVDATLAGVAGGFGAAAGGGFAVKTALMDGMQSVAASAGSYIGQWAVQTAVDSEFQSAQQTSGTSIPTETYLEAAAEPPDPFAGQTLDSPYHDQTIDAYDPYPVGGWE